jgi:hypothetical protein
MTGSNPAVNAIATRFSALRFSFLRLRCSMTSCVARTLLVSAAVGALATGCARPAVSVEVLPPRMSATCAAPSSSAAFGQGLFDVTTTLGAHGSYLADLRLSVPGADVRVDGIKVSYDVPKDSTVDGASYDGEVLTGDAVLSGDKDDLRVGVVENVELVSRDMAVAFRDDSGAGIDKIEYATMGITITPVVDEDVAEGVPTTFALDLCKGCLVTPPDICSDAGEFNATPVVCRPGQDIPLFTCNAAVVGAP